MTRDAEPQVTRETAFHQRTARLTRDFVAYRGYWLPNSFTDHGAAEEYRACRERAALIDLSALRKFEVTGPDAEALLQHCLTGNLRRLAVGQVLYTAMCNEAGGMIDDGTVMRLGPDSFRWIGGGDHGGVRLREQAEKLGLRAWVQASTDRLHNIALQGPKSREILRQVVWTPPAQPSLEELARFRFLVGRVGGFDGIVVVVSRTGYTGELGYEVWCHPKDAVAVWDAVWAAGEPHGMAPMGLAALDTARIEAGLVLANHEFSDQTDPFEAGIGFTVPLGTKEDDFIGRAALVRRKENRQRALVGLELGGDGPAAQGDSVCLAQVGAQVGAQIGEVTSATRSPALEKTIALCLIDVACAEPGIEVEVVKTGGREKRRPAKVVRLPFYDPDKTRVRT